MLSADDEVEPVGVGMQAGEEGDLPSDDDVLAVDDHEVPAAHSEHEEEEHHDLPSPVIVDDHDEPASVAVKQVEEAAEHQDLPIDEPRLEKVEEHEAPA